MNGVGGAGAYGALANTSRTEGSVSILRRAGDSAKPERTETAPPEIAVTGTAGERDEDAAAAASTPSRPIGNLGRHLDLKL